MSFATTDVKLKNLDSDNFFETTLKTLVTDGTDTNIYLNALPAATESFLTIEPTVASKKEIIFYNAKGADYVTCPSASAGRGVGGTTAQGHAASSVVRASNPAEIAEVLRDRILALNNGWIPADETATCGTNNILTVASGAASKYSVGDKLKIVVGGVTYYGYAITIADTAVTGIWGDATGAAYTLASGATITSLHYSKMTSPVGFPDWFNWTPTMPNVASMTVTLTAVNYARFRIVGRELTYKVYLSHNTAGSAADYAAFTLPLATKDDEIHLGSSHSNINGLTQCFDKVATDNTTALVTPHVATLKWYIGNGLYIKSKGSYEI